MTPAERQAKLEAAKALMSEVEADGVPASPIAETVAQPPVTPVPVSAIPSAAPIPFPTKAAVAAQAKTPQAQAVAAAIGLKPPPALPASPKVPASGPKVDTVAAHASTTQPSLWSTLMSVALKMKGQK